MIDSQKDKNEIISAIVIVIAIVIAIVITIVIAIVIAIVIVIVITIAIESLCCIETGKRKLREISENSKEVIKGDKRRRNE